MASRHLSTYSVEMVGIRCNVPIAPIRYPIVYSYTHERKWHHIWWLYWKLHLIVGTYTACMLIINKNYVSYPQNCGRSDPKCLAPFHLHSNHLRSTQIYIICIALNFVHIINRKDSGREQWGRCNQFVPYVPCKYWDYVIDD